MLPSQTETYPLTDPAFLEDPYPVYRRMRRHVPVYWSAALGHWVLTRDDDVLAAARNPALSSATTEVSVRAQLRGSDPALAADHTRIQTVQLFRCQLRSGERRHLITHLLQALRHTIPRAGNVANLPAANRHLQANGLDARRRLKQLRRDVAVLKLDSLAAEIFTLDHCVRRKCRAGWFCWSGHGEGDFAAPACFCNL